MEAERQREAFFTTTTKTIKGKCLPGILFLKIDKIIDRGIYQIKNANFRIVVVS